MKNGLKIAGILVVKALAESIIFTVSGYYNYTHPPEPISFSLLEMRNNWRVGTE